MKERRLGMLSLRLDAIYCAVLGGALAVTAPTLSGAVALPVPVIAAGGVVVVLWAGLVEWMRAHWDLRVTLRIVVIANLTATLAIAAVSFTAAAFLAVLAIGAVAVDVALFVGSQALALGRLRPQAP